MTAKTRKTIQVLSGFFIVIACIFLYFILHVNEREEHLSEHNFRILAQISDDFDGKIKTFSSNVANIKKDFKADDFKSIQHEVKIAKQSGAINPNLYILEYRDYYSMDAIDSSVSISSNEVRVTKKVKINSKEKVWTWGESLETFMKNLLWMEEFQEYVLVDESHVLYQTGNLGIHKLSLDSLCTLSNTNSGLMPGTEKTITLSGVPHKVFTYPFRVQNSNKRYGLIGIMTLSDYQDHSMQLAPFTIILTVIIFFVLLLSFPFIKLLLISKTERLNKFDLIITLVSLFGITSLACLLTLNGLQYRSYRNGKMNMALNRIAGNIASNFTSEISSALEQMHIYDKLYHDSLTTDIVSLNTHPTVSPKLYKSFDMIAWINEKGEQINKYSTRAENTKKVDVSKRAYFSSIANGEAWKWDFFTNKPNIPKEFFLQSIYSVTTGKPYAVLSAPSSQGDMVVSMTAHIQSVNNPVLRTGIKFAFINPEGDVILHSDKTKNLHENILFDMDNKKSVHAMIKGRESSTFDTRYHGDQYLAQIQPIGTLPLFLVTFYDTAYYKSANAGVLSFSIIFIVFLGIIILILSASIFVACYTGGKLSYPQFRFNWILPQQEGAHLYRRTLVYNALLCVIFGLFYVIIDAQSVESYGQLMLITVISPLYIILGSYFLIFNGRINGGFLRRHWLLWITAVLILFSITVFAWNKVPLTLFFLFQLSLVLLAIISAKRSNKGNFKIERSYVLYYKLALVSLVVSLCMPSAYTFFKLSHDTELRLYNKLVLKSVAEQMSNPAVNRSYSLVRPDSLVALHEDFRITPLPLELQNSVQGKSEQNTPKSKTFDEDFFWDTYIKTRPVFSEKMVDTKYLNTRYNNNKTWHFFDYKDSVSLYYQSTVFDNNKGLFQLKSSLNEYGFLKSRLANWPILILICLGLVSILFILVNFIFNKTVISYNPEGTNPLLTPISLNGKLSLNQNLFLVGLPKAGKLRYLKNSLGLTNHIFTIDTADFSKNQSEIEALVAAIASDTKAIVLDNFEQGNTDPGALDSKLTLLESLIKPRGIFIPIILLSSSHPFDLFDDNILSELTGLEKHQAHLLAERWIRLTSHFYKSFIPIDGNLDSKPFEMDDVSINQLIEAECRLGTFLPELIPSLKSYFAAYPGKNEDVILKIQSMATFYYFSLWNSCNKEEKFLLYDLAQDNLVNTKNVKTISMLLKKGLVIFNGTLNIMNRSFRNFILTNIDATDAKELHEEVSSSSTWSMIRIPLILTIVFLGGFIFYTQKSFFNEILAFVASIATALPLVLKIISSVKTSKSVSP